MKILRSRKALSPVVASIILIAVTVAVSIAVAAWMGALSFSFMGTGESLQVGTPYAWNSTSVTITVTNTGGGIVTIKWFRVAGTQVALNSTYGGIPLGPKDTQNVVCNGTSFTLGYSYTIVLITSNNKEFPTTGVYNP
ncbi:MAG: archaellin/type IV pilin N-terminal domain-containing protein [Candidatus Bathyarchaeia archaeon]